jgi:hypothetical protein
MRFIGKVNPKGAAMFLESMKTSTKIIGGILLGLGALVLIAVGAAFWVYSTFIDYRSIFPKQLKIKKVVQEAKRTHSMGPSGINNAFVVYELPEKASAKIAAGGLDYLNSLPFSWAQKTQPGLPDAPTWNWFAAPVPSQQEWLRGRREIADPWTPSILNFYNMTPDDSFLSLIPPEFQDSFHEAIRTPGNYCSYVGHNTLIVSPSQGRAYFLHRS